MGNAEMAVADDGSSLTNLQITLVACTGLLLALAMAVKAKQFWDTRHMKLPPGPRGMPFLGVLPLMGKKRHATIQKWWEQYGDVFSMYMGSKLVIVINGLEAYKESFVKQADTFSGRPNNYFKKITDNSG